MVQFCAGVNSQNRSLVTVNTRQASGMFFHILADRVTCPMVFCMQSDMLKAHRVASSSMISPSHVLSFAECFWFVYLMFLLDHWFGGWYGVARLCSAPSSFRKFRKVLSMKWDPPSLITILGVPKRGNMTSWNILRAFLASAAQHGIASTHFDT